MKFKLFVISILSISLFLCCCGSNQTDNMVTFYYCQSQLDYDSPQGAFATETHHHIPDPFAYTQLLEKYLEGPENTNLRSPIPKDVKLISLTIDQQTAHITLSNSFANLTGVDLTMACVCISMTAKNITGCSFVQIQAQNAMLENRQSITINTNLIRISDLSS